MSTSDTIIQAIIALVMIGNPIDPVKILIFNQVIAASGQNRVVAALKLGLIVAAILGGAVLIGKELLELIGINLGAFGFVGGLIVAGMGFEMVYAGRPPKAQGADDRETVTRDGVSDDVGLIMPLAIPLMAGPGALTTAITIASTGEGSTGVIAGLIGAALMGVLVVVGMGLFGNLLSRASPGATALMQRLGGLLLATIGAQLALSGIRTFYKF